MKIIHISDLHICSNYKRNNILKIKKLFKDISETGAGHIIITGDISDNANEKDYQILKKILQAFNLYSSEKTTIIPGNHDIFGGVQKVEDIINFPAKCAGVDLRKSAADFVEQFKELFENTYFPLDKSYFPFAKPLDGVVLIGINTVAKYSRIRNPLASNGKIGKKQFNALLEILNAKSFSDFRKVVLSHHHFYKNSQEVRSSESILWNKIEKYTMKLRGKRKLLNAFKESNVELVLHGHSHDMKEYEREGVLFLNAGGSIENTFPGSSLVYTADLSAGKINPVMQILNGQRNALSGEPVYF